MIDGKVSIIIPHRNQHAQLRKCLDRLILLGYGDQEIIVVDNGSEDFPDFLAEYQVSAFRTDDRPSPYIARNLGISNAKCKIIALLDVNATVETGWLENARKILRDDIILGGTIARPNPASLDIFQRFDYLHSVVYWNLDESIKALPGGNLFFYKKVWTKVGPFREVRSLGDMEWTSRAQKMGFELKVDPGIRFQYPFKTGKVFSAKYRRLGKGHAENDFHRFPLWYVVKNLLPPSLAFVRNMQDRNRNERMGLSWLQIFLLCYWVKINYAWGYVDYFLTEDSRSDRITTPADRSKSH